MNNLIHNVMYDFFSAMASWQCQIGTNLETATILCTGDKDGQVIKVNEEYFFTQMILPMSTFAVAIGQWTSKPLVSQAMLQTALKPSKSECKWLHEPYPCHIRRGDSGPLIPCRLIGPPKIVEKAIPLWSAYLPACLESTYELLGPHPFQKLDIVIVARCYSGLGLASPSLMFVSQTLALDPDGGMIIRLAHEISHNYFGLLIGAMDWTEEWLTEVKLITFPD